MISTRFGGRFFQWSFLIKNIRTLQEDLERDEDLADSEDEIDEDTLEYLETLAKHQSKKERVCISRLWRRIFQFRSCENCLVCCFLSTLSSVRTLVWLSFLFVNFASACVSITVVT